ATQGLIGPALRPDRSSDLAKLDGCPSRKPVVLDILDFAWPRCLHIHDGKFCTSMLPRIRRLGGRRSRSSKPSHGAARRSISFEIVMRSTEGHFKSGFTAPLDVSREILQESRDVE